MNFINKYFTAITWTTLIVLVTLVVYSQRYTLNGDNTATQGIIFQKTIYLKEYKHLGRGNGVFGGYERYSRSDRHTEVLTVYKD